MSSTSTSTSTSTPTSSSSNSDTATLYLFTFLATILILVLLSASLVLRSYVLRRRYRQRFQQALADGLFADPDRSPFNGAAQFDPLGGFRRSTRQLGPKPVVWDTWTHPADKADTLSSITPVAVRCTPLLSPPSTLMSSPQPCTRPLFPQLRIQSPFSLSPRPSSPVPAPARTPTGSPTPSDPGTRTEKDAAMLAVCVLVAMPDVSSPVHRPLPDPKGKGVDPLESQAHGTDPLLPSTLPQGTRISDPPVDEEGLPLLEFGVVEMKTAEWP